MADDVTFPLTGVGDATSKMAANDIAGVYYQRIKLSLGAPGTAADAPVGGGVESGALRVTLANDSTGLVSVDDNGGSLTVDGTIAVSTLPALVAGTANIGDVDVLSVPGDPFGANADAASATGNISAKLRFIATTGIPVTSLPAVTNAGTFAVQDSEKIADNAAFTDGTTKVNPVGFVFDETAGTALTENDIAAGRIDSKRAIVFSLEDETTRGRRVTVTAANALKVDASAAAVPITDNAGSLTVDAPVGTPAFVRLSDGSAAIATLPVSLASVPSHAVTNAGTFAVQADTELMAAAALADAASATPTTPSVGAVPLLMNATTLDRQRAVVAALDSVGTGIAAAGLVGQLDDTSTAAVTENQFAPVRISTRRALLQDRILLSGSGSLTGSGQAVTLTMTPLSFANAVFQLSGTWVGTITFEASNDNANWNSISGLKVSDGVIAQTATVNDHYRVTVSGFGYVRARCSAYTSGTIVVTANASPNTSGVVLNIPLPAGTNAIGTVTASNTAGDIAHDGVDSGNPVKIGARAIAHGTNPTAVAAADRTDWLANRAGVPFVMGGHPNIVTVRLQFTAVQTNVAVVTVAGGLKIVVTGFQVTVDNTTTVFPSILLGFGATTTPTTTGVIGAHGGVPAGGGFGRGDGSGILGIGADGEDLRITTSGTVTGNGVELVVTYYTIES